MTGAAGTPGGHAPGYGVNAGAPGVIDTGPGTTPTLGPVIDPEDAARIDAWAARQAEGAPELTPARLERLRRLIRPPRTPRPSARPGRREPPADGPRCPADGPR